MEQEGLTVDLFDIFSDEAQRYLEEQQRGQGRG